MNKGKLHIWYLNTANQEMIEVPLTHIATQMTCIGLLSQPIGSICVHIIGANAKGNTGESFCMSKVRSHSFPKTLADAVHIHGVQR